MDNRQVVLVISTDDEDEANKMKKCTEEEAARDGGSGRVQAEVDVSKKRMKNNRWKRRKKQKNENKVNNQQSLENISDDDVKIREQSETLKAVVGTRKVLEDDAAKKGEQIDIVKAVESTNNVETNSVLKSKNDVAEMLVDSGKKDELGDKFQNVVKTKAFEAGDGYSSTTVNICLPSAVDNKVAADLSSSIVIEETVHAAMVKMLKAQADTLEDVETAKAIKVGESVRPIDVIDLISSSSDEDEVIADVITSEDVEGTLPLKPIVDVVKEGSQPNTVEPGRLVKELANESVPITEHNTPQQIFVDVVKEGSQPNTVEPGRVVKELANESVPITEHITPQQIFKEKHVDTGEDSETVKSYETNSVEKKNNIVLQKLLRGPRYFDPQGTNLEMCFHCGKEGHKAFQCIAKRRSKPCFVCGVFGHGGMSCKQGLECFFCKRTGHFARNCPDKTEEIYSISNICLRCGELEHDMWTCNGDYPNDDLKDIQCYICKNFGHLCCVDYPNLGSKQVSCYNCGQPGHVGSECTKLDRKIGSRPSTGICRKCGERGHVTRKCKKIHTKAAKNADLLSQRDPNQKREISGSKSAPPDFNKARGKRKAQYTPPDENVHLADLFQAAKKADLLAQRDPNEKREISGSKSAPPDENVHLADLLQAAKKADLLAQRDPNEKRADLLQAAKKADLLAQRDPNEKREISGSKSAPPDENVHLADLLQAAKKADLLAQRDPNEKREISGSKSAPPDFNKARGKRKAQYYERASATAFRPRGAGMWNAQGGEVLVYRDLGPNMWRAPSTSTRNNQEMRALTAYGNFLSPQTPSQTFSYPAAQASSATNNQELAPRKIISYPRALSASGNFSTPQNSSHMFNHPPTPGSSFQNNQGMFALSAPGNFVNPQNPVQMFNHPATPSSQAYQPRFAKHPPTPGSSFQNNQGMFALSAPGNFVNPQNPVQMFNHPATPSSQAYQPRFAKHPPTPGSSFQNNQGMFALSPPGNFVNPQNPVQMFNHPATPSSQAYQPRFAKHPPTPGSSFQNNQGMFALSAPDNFVNPQNPVQRFNHPATPSSQAYQPRFAPPRFGDHGYGGVNQFRYL